jgi:hypothetical protein
MKKLLSLVLVLALLAFVIGCKSALEHKNSALGGDPPDWAFMEMDELEALEKYADFYVFKFDQVGEDLEGVKAWTRSFSAATEVARMVSTRVMNKFAGAQVGDRDMVETYMEEVAKVLAVAEYSGARRAGDFWVLQQTFDDKGKPDKRIYRYWLLYTVPREQIEDAIERALNEEDQKNKPKTEEEKVARDRVQELFGEGL